MLKKTLGDLADGGIKTLPGHIVADARRPHVHLGGLCKKVKFHGETVLKYAKVLV